jgi:mannose-1-phosphate guanylyltransferase
MKRINFYPVILAGGRGTRFWPLSRRRRAKQLLVLDGKHTMIQQTVGRLRRLAPRKNFWVITNRDLRELVAQQLPELGGKQIIAEPAARNTAPAVGLAAFILQRSDPDAVIGMFPSDHVIADEKRFRERIQAAARLAVEDGQIVVMGIPPARPETGYGYIEVGETLPGGIMRVRRFTEKPSLERAKEFVAAGNYFWNSGMFIWSAKTLTEALREHLPKTASVLEEIAETAGTRKLAATLKKLYPKCENISVDYAVVEPRSAKGEAKSGLYCIPADFGWNDLGSWNALHEHKSAGKKALKDGNVVEAEASLMLNSEGNYLHAPGKFVAAVGVNNVVVVETEDALLVTTREHSQDVGKIVKYLDEMKRRKLT